MISRLDSSSTLGTLSITSSPASSLKARAACPTPWLKISVSAFQALLQMVPEISTPFLLAICKTLAARIRADDKRYRDSVNFARTANWKSFTD